MMVHRVINIREMRGSRTVDDEPGGENDRGRGEARGQVAVASFSIRHSQQECTVPASLHPAVSVHGNNMDSPVTRPIGSDTDEV